MRVSVVLPNYNHARWLPRALSCLVRQLEESDELIVVDDASTDESLAVIQRFQAENSSIKLIRHEVNQGAEQAVKSALEQVSGDLLLFAAADDFILPGLISRGRAALSEHEQAAFFCAEVVLVDEADRVLGFRPIVIPRSTPGYVSPGDVRKLVEVSDGWFIGNSVLYRRRHLASIGYFDRSLGTLQDAIATRLLAFEHGFYFCPEVLAAWRSTPNTLSGQVALAPEQNIRALNAARAWILGRFPKELRDRYAILFDRRLRFNFARARILANPGNGSVASLVGNSRLDRVLLDWLARLPFGSVNARLAWLTLRLRPYGFARMVASLWRHRVVESGRREKVAQVIASL